MSAKVFIKRFIKHPLKTGAILPSSPLLAKALLKKHDFSGRILELGAGTGAVTKYILKKIQKNHPYDIIEIDPVLADHLKKKYKIANIYIDDAEMFFKQKKQRYACVISGIPFAAIKPAKRQRMFKQIKKHLKPGGMFSMFQYSLTTKKELQYIFKKENVEIEFVPLNVPPAFVYRCKVK
jgi:phospholipid N-methyltransferase